MSSKSNPNNMDDRPWIINIRRSLEQQDHNIVQGHHLTDEEQLPVRIFNVPKPLLSTHPDSYTPQQVAIGPYHHHRPDLHEAARHKHSSATRLQRRLHPSVTYREMVDQLTKLVPMVRDCYHKYLDFSDETLAWMMAIDASLLLDLIGFHGGARAGGGDDTRSGFKNNVMVRDVVMLENQIPMIMLRKIVEVQFGAREVGDAKLKDTLVGFCREVSPFKMMDDLAGIEVSHSSHLLDYLYATILPDQAVKEVTAEDQVTAAEGSSADGNDSESSSKRGLINLTGIRKVTSKLNKEVFKRLLQSRPLKLILRLPFIILTTVLPGFAVLRHPVEYFLFSSPSHNKQEPSSNLNSNFNGQDRPPLLEEITIPSVTELVSSGIRIIPTTCGVLSITFDAKASELHLPTVRLDVNTEVVLRNLVAYEASNTEGALVFTRYTELMNGIVDTREDVKLLRERGVVLNHLKSDDEAADLWNGMSKSIRLTKVPFLDEVIREVNVYYNGRWKVRIGRFMGKYVFASWQTLTLFAAILVLVLMAFQVFCSLYNWYRILSIRRAV